MSNSYNTRISLTRYMVFLSVLLLSALQVAAAPWANNSFDDCKNITIINTGSSALTNFPAYINLTFDSDMQANYSDLRFFNSSCDNGGSRMDYEIENYTATNAHVWVRVPTLSTGNTTISVYFKNNTAVGSGQNASGVWNNNFISVWPLCC